MNSQTKTHSFQLNVQKSVVSEKLQGSPIIPNEPANGPGGSQYDSAKSGQEGEIIVDEDNEGNGGGGGGGGGGDNGGGGGNGESEGEDEDEYDTREFPDFLNFQLAIMKNERMLKSLIMYLYDSLLLSDFITLMQVLSTGKLEARNLPLLCCLERAKFCKLKSTTLMRFYSETKAFYRVAYRTFHGKGLLLMSGSKNQGQVRDGITKRGLYDPQQASVNFVVPDVKTLFNNDEALKEIPPTSKIQQSYNFVDRTKEHVLTYDGKKLSRGYKGKKYGDEDMWGIENKPTLEESVTQLQKELDTVRHFQECQEDNNLLMQAFHADEMLSCVSERIRSIRKLEWMHRNDLNKYEKDPHSSDYSKSFKRSQIFACQSCTEKALMVTGAICEIKAEMNSMIQYFTAQSPVNLTIQENYDILFEPYIIGRFCEQLMENSEIVKQGTFAWENLRKRARVTGSSASKAIALHTRKNAQEHFDEFMLNKERPTPTPELQEMFDHGHREEVSYKNMMLSIILVSQTQYYDIQ